MSTYPEIKIPYVHLNLRFNPFGGLSPEERGRLAIVDIDTHNIARRVAKPGFAVLFLGDSGRGKSTHLLAIRNHFPDAPYIYLGPRKLVPTIPVAPLLFIDEMQRMPRRMRREILQRRASFVIGSHKNHSRDFRSAGLSFDVIKVKGLSAERLLEIVNKRIEWARRSDDKPVPSISYEVAEQLIGHFGDDLWAIEDYLYECFQELPGPVPIQLDLKPRSFPGFNLFGRLPHLSSSVTNRRRKSQEKDRLAQV